MALSARREIHESWISRKRDRCLLALSIPSFSIPTSTIEERMRREREKETWQKPRGNEENKSEGRVSICNPDDICKLKTRIASTLKHNVHRIVRIIRWIERDSFRLDVTRISSRLSFKIKLRVRPRKRTRKCSRERFVPHDYAIFIRRLSR